VPLCRNLVNHYTAASEPDARGCSPSFAEFESTHERHAQAVRAPGKIGLVSAGKRALLRPLDGAVAESIHTLPTWKPGRFPARLAVIGRPSRTAQPGDPQCRPGRARAAQPRYATGITSSSTSPANCRAPSPFPPARFHGLNLTVPHKSLAWNT